MFLKNEIGNIFKETYCRATRWTYCAIFSAFDIVLNSCHISTMLIFVYTCCFSVSYFFYTYFLLDEEALQVVKNYVSCFLYLKKVTLSDRGADRYHFWKKIFVLDFSLEIRFRKHCSFLQNISLNSFSSIRYYQKLESSFLVKYLSGKFKEL